MSSCKMFLAILALAMLIGMPMAARATVTISTQPVSLALTLGDQAVFNVTASGAGTLAYQWKKNGNSIGGATLAYLLINPVAFSDAGNYTVDVTDTGGTVTSSAAGLGVNSPKSGSLDFSFAGGSVVDGTIQSVAVQSDGKVLIGGGFSTVNGTSRNFIARLNSDGTLDTGFGNGLAGADSTVNSVAVQSDGKVLIGGAFTTVNGTARNGIARLNSDGTLDTGFGNGLAGAIAVVSVAVQSDGKVLIGGGFTTVNGTARGSIARLNSDGTLDTTFGNGLVGANNTVRSVAVQSDGKVLIGGDFTLVNGTASGRIARLNSDGTLDTTFGNGLAGANNMVFSVAVQSDGKVLIGGIFLTVNGTVRAYLARLYNDSSADADLSALTLGSGSLSPTFASGTITYSNAIALSANSLTVTPTSSAASAVIRVRVNGGGYATVASATPSSALPLNVGPNIIEVQVTSAGSTVVKTYSVTVNAVDTNAPVITLSGNASVTAECHTSYIDLGATATDDFAGSVAVTPGGSVDINSVGDYTLSYVATDPSGNSATNTRAVHVVDTTAPNITVTGNDPLIVECHGTFSDPGATASDTCAGNLTGSISTSGSVNANAVGSYTLTYSVSDGFNSTSATRIVTVGDSIAPSVTLNGAPDVTVECHGVYTELGATASDSCDASVTTATITGGSVNANLAGDYTLTYSATDSAGNNSSSTRVVTVSDATPPTVVANATNVIVECHGTFTDAGATVGDTCDSNPVVVTNNPVNDDTVGVYTVTYTATDAGGNSASATTLVTVSDTQAPIISVLPGAVTTECHGSYTDPGATANDACEGSVSVNTSGTVDVNTVGDYTLTYSATDSASNASISYRTVTVADTTAPLVTLNGGDSTICQLSSYSEAGATANDSCEGNLSVTVTGSVDPGTVGAYTLTYTATDSSNNSGSQIRVVNVIACTPVISVQPQSQNLIASQTLTLSVTASGTGITYQWKKDGSPIANATDSSYSKVNITTSDAGFYSVDVTVGGTTPSDPAMITVSNLGIITQPLSQNGVVGTTNTFTVVAAGTPTLRYQWLKNGVKIPKATNSTCAIKVAATSGAIYSCVVSNGPVSTVTSSGAALAIYAKTTITNPANNKNKTPGNNVTFKAVGHGTGTLSYQWEFNPGTGFAGLSDSARIIGSTSSNLTIINIQSGDIGTYRCTAANVASSATSDGIAHGILSEIPDATAPVVTILAPLNKAKMTNGLAVTGQTNVAPEVDISGKAVDNGLITDVTLTRTVPLSAGTAAVMTHSKPGKVTWTNHVTLVDGTNTFVAMATDSAGLIGTSVARTYYLLTPATLAVNITGNAGKSKVVGKASAFGTPTNGVSLDIGIGYTITAQPAAGKVFLNWTDAFDNILTTSKTNNFIMSSGLMLKANFAP